jgi:hypothetical protein
MTLHIGPDIDLTLRWLAGQGHSPGHRKPQRGRQRALARHDERTSHA